MFNRSCLLRLHILLFFIYNAISEYRYLEETNSPRIIHYVTNNEGIVAHLRKVYDVWLKAAAVNASIYITGFHSGHYPDVEVVNLCDVFLFTDSITCIVETKDSIYDKHTCVSVDAKWEPDDKRIKHVSAETDFTKIDCLTGGYYIKSDWQDKYQKIVGKNYMHRPYFTHKYLKLFNKAKQGLGLDDQNYWVVHWRRADVLRNRCKDRHRSFNCENETQLVSRVKQHLHTYSDDSKLKVYLATNEQNPNILRNLTKQGFILFSHVIEVFNRSTDPVHLNKLDMFALELMFMCHANYLMTWGRSSISAFFLHKYCRNKDQFPQKITLYDDNEDITKSPFHR
jgi:hypothetical protein